MYVAWKAGHGIILRVYLWQYVYLASHGTSEYYTVYYAVEQLVTNPTIITHTAHDLMTRV